MGETRSVPAHSGQDHQPHVGRCHPPGETDPCKNLEPRELKWPSIIYHIWPYGLAEYF